MLRLALVLTIATTGCAATLQQRPVVGRACSPSKLWIADAVVSAAIASAAIYGATRGNDEIASGASVEGFEVMGVGLVAGTATLASMVTGLKWNGQCRRGEASAIAAR